MNLFNIIREQVNLSKEYNDDDDDAIIKNYKKYPYIIKRK